MSKINTGGPAFPMPCGEYSYKGVGKYNNPQEGMTLRDYFAAKAMQGLLSNKYMGDAALHESAQEWLKDISETAYEFADAMLAERESGE